jgi:hypothetical protein
MYCGRCIQNKRGYSNKKTTVAVFIFQLFSIHILNLKTLLDMPSESGEKPMGGKSPDDFLTGLFEGVLVQKKVHQLILHPLEQTEACQSERTQQ